MFHFRKIKNVLYNGRKFSQVALTSTKFENVKRSPFKILSDSDVTFFEKVLDKNRVITNDEDLKPYNTDWMNAFRGQSKIVLKPKSSAEISSILSFCNKESLAVVPQGGNTGLVGGSVPVFDEVIISMGLMNKITSIDELTGSVVCESGVVLEKLNEELNKHNLTVPVDLGAKGSCHIGGNISTNAGGIRLIRYGSLHGNVLGLKVVLPDGEILDLLTSLRKDNTGYDLKHLFVGAEGTLGIITDVSLLCPTKPNYVNAAFLGLASFDKVLETFKIAKSNLSEILSAFELMDRDSINAVEQQLGYHNPLSDNYEYYVLVETSGSQQDHDQDKLNSFLTQVMEKDHVLDGAVAQDQSQLQSMWNIRENINLACARSGGHVYKFDYTTQIGKSRELIELVKSEFSLSYGEDQSILLIVGYGHVGDGNLHLNVVSSKYNAELNKKLEHFVYNWLKENRGSISAEHGLGLKKAPYLHYSKPPLAIKYMKNIKQLFDPKGIMNPYKYLPN